MSSLKTGTEFVQNARVDGDVVRASLHGEIDLEKSPEVRTALLDLLQKVQPNRLVLDLSDVPYMDSSAIAVLVESLQRLRKTGGKVCLTHLQPRVRGLLEIARLDTIFVVADSDEEAMNR